MHLGRSPVRLAFSCDLERSGRLDHSV